MANSKSNAGMESLGSRLSYYQPVVWVATDKCVQCSEIDLVLIDASFGELDVFEPLSHWTHGRGAKVHNSQARGYSKATGCSKARCCSKATGPISTVPSLMG